MSVNVPGRATALKGPAGHTAGIAIVAAVAAGALIAGAPLSVLVVGLGLVVVGVALAKPELVTPAVLFLLFLDVPGVAVRKYGAPPLLAALIIAALAIPVANEALRGNRLRFCWPIGLVAAFAVVQLASTVASREPSAALGHFVPFLLEGLLLAVLVLNAIRSVATLERVLWALLLAGACLGAVSLLQQITGTFDKPYGGFALVPVEFFRGIEPQARLSGPIGDPNYYAQILVPLIPIGLIALRGAQRRLRLVATGATLAAMGGLVLSYSRGGALALVLMLALAAAFRYVKGSQLVLIGLAVVVALAVVPNYRARVASIGSSLTGATEEKGSSKAADQAVRGRTGEMAAAALVFSDHPVVGVGPGAFPLYYQQYIKRLGLEAHTSVKTGPNRGEEAQREAHNIFISIAAELGLAGLAVFLAIICTAFAGLVRARRRCLDSDPRLARIATAMLIALAGYLITGLFLTLAYERYFWVLVGVSGAVIQLARAPAPEPAPQPADGPRGRRPGSVRGRPIQPTGT